MNPAVTLAAQEQLQPGEQLLWSGQGKPVRLAIQGLPAALFGVPFTAFAVFWMWMAAGQRVPDLSGGRFQDYFFLWGVPFVLVGLRMLLAPLWLYWKASRVIYAVSDRRALVITTAWRKTVQSFGPGELGQIERKELADGCGDLVFVATQPEQTGWRSQRSPGRVAAGFFGIAEARRVEQLLVGLSRKKEK